MEVPRLGVESELQLLAYATATVMWDLNRACDLYHSSQQHRILNPLSEARDRTCILVGFVTTEPQWELLPNHFNQIIYHVCACTHTHTNHFILKNSGTQKTCKTITMNSHIDSPTTISTHVLSLSILSNTLIKKALLHSAGKSTQYSSNLDRKRI